MSQYPENRSYTTDPNAPFPAGDVIPYYTGTATRYVDNLNGLVREHTPLFQDEPHPLDKMMRRVMVEQSRPKLGHVKTFRALRDLAAIWNGPDDPRNDFDAVSEGLALALVFVRESHIIPSQYGDFSEELTRMQCYADPDAPTTIASFTNNAWQGMHRDHPVVYQLFSEVRDLLLEYHHVEADDPQVMRINAGMGLVYMVSVASKLQEATGKFTTIDDYFEPLGLEAGETRQDAVDDWRDLEPLVTPDLHTIIGNKRSCISDRERNPPLPVEIIRQREVLAALALELLNAERKRDYEATKDRTRSILGAFLHPDQGAAKEQRRKREAIEDRKALEEHEKSFEEDE